MRDALEGHFEGLGNSLRWVIFAGCGHGGDGGDERAVVLSLPCKTRKERRASECVEPSSCPEPVTFLAPLYALAA